MLRHRGKVKEMRSPEDAGEVGEASARLEGPHAASLESAVWPEQSSQPDAQRSTDERRAAQLALK